MKYSCLFVFVVVLTLLTLSSTQLPLTWDEGEMDARAYGVGEWSRHLFRVLPGGTWCFPDKPDGSDAEKHSLVMLLSNWGLTFFWTGTVTEEGHPQFPVFLTAFGKLICPSFFPEDTRIRFGTILWFSAAVGAMFHRLRREFDTKTAIFAVSSLLLVPRLFAHAQIAAWDSTLTASWLFAWAFFPRKFDSDIRAVVWGVFLGITFASKFPGWAAPLPFIVWFLCRLRWERSAFAGIARSDLCKRGLAVGATALLVFFLLNPPLWLFPIEGLQKFFFLNTRRELNISILFFGKLYDLHHSLPWYNTLLWTAITVPVALLFFFAVGLKETLRNEPKRWAGLLLVLNMATPLILRALPGTPVHDGVRLFVTAFPFLAILAGIGVAACWTTWKKKILIVAVYGACVFNMFWYAPQWLSFYNLAVGGLPGAVRLGMEPTYYWDALDGETLDWLNAHTPPDKNVAFSFGPYETLAVYRTTKRLIPDYWAAYGDLSFDEMREPLNCRWYVLQCRTGLFLDRDRTLRERQDPVYVKTMRRSGFGPWNLGAVPLLEIYDLQADTGAGGVDGIPPQPPDGRAAETAEKSER